MVFMPMGELNETSCRARELDRERERERERMGVKDEHMGIKLLCFSMYTSTRASIYLSLYVYVCTCLITYLFLVVS